MSSEGKKTVGRGEAVGRGEGGTKAPSKEHKRSDQVLLCSILFSFYYRDSAWQSLLCTYRCILFYDFHVLWSFMY